MHFGWTIISMNHSFRNAQVEILLGVWTWAFRLNKHLYCIKTIQIRNNCGSTFRFKADGSFHFLSSSLSDIDRTVCCAERQNTNVIKHSFWKDLIFDGCKWLVWQFWIILNQFGKTVVIENLYVFGGPRSHHKYHWPNSIAGRTNSRAGSGVPIRCGYHIFRQEGTNNEIKNKQEMKMRATLMKFMIQNANRFPNR
jgi:hypothetical protein